MIAEIWGGVKRKMLRPQYFYNIFFPSYFGNVIATFHFFFLKKKKWYVHTIFTIFLQQILSGRLLLLD